MFKFLKEKINNWAKKISKDKEKEVEIEISKEEKEKIKKEVKKAEKERKTHETSLAKVSETKEKKGFFRKIRDKIKKIKISEKDFEIYGEELEMLLLENNVALEVTEKIIKELKEKIVGKELLKKEIEYEIKDCFKEIIKEILIEPFDLIEKIK